MKCLMLIGAVLLALMGLPATAQDDCTDGFVCVDYGSQVVEIDPSLGFLQSLVVEERTLTITDFDGTRTEPQVKLATFIQDDDTYRLEREDVVPQDGPYEDARLSDVYTPQKVK